MPLKPAFRNDPAPRSHTQRGVGKVAEEANFSPF
jgi:hypothetical protein